MTLTLDEMVSRLEAHHPDHAAVSFQDVLRPVRIALGSHRGFLDYYTRMDSDFVYDATSGLYLVGYVGRHVELMAALYDYYCETGLPHVYDAADAFVLSDLGMFKSTAGPRIYHSASFRIPAELAPITRDFRVLEP